MNRTPSIVAALSCALFAGALAAAPVERKLDVAVTLDGQQDWRNVLQWSKATTTQRYEISTTLRSDGKLEGANLLDPNLDRRLAIKTEYLRRQGMAKLKAAGLDPKSPDLQRQIGDRAQKESFSCKGNPVCMGEVSGKYAELLAAALEPDNSALFEGEPRYLFFTGYPGCSNRIRAVNKNSTKGETAYGRNKDKIFPYALEYDGDSTGSEQDRQSLCTLFTVVVDTKEQKMFVENVYLPPSRGKVVRTEFEKTQNTEADLPQPEGLQAWVNDTLRHSAFSGATNSVLNLNLPLDGNSTVLGSFTGKAKVTLNWALTELPAKK
jgi:hypothetical protein